MLLGQQNLNLVKLVFARTNTNNTPRLANLFKPGRPSFEILHLKKLNFELTGFSPAQLNHQNKKQFRIGVIACSSKALNDFIRSSFFQMAHLVPHEMGHFEVSRMGKDWRQ